MSSMSMSVEALHVWAPMEGEMSPKSTMSSMATSGTVHKHKNKRGQCKRQKNM